MKKLILILVLFAASFSAHAFDPRLPVNDANPMPVAVISGGGGGGSALPNATTNITQFGSAAVVTGIGIGGVGIPRVTVSSDSFPASTTVSNIVNVTGYRGTSTDRSGTITTAGTSQTLSALNANRVHFEIQANLSNTTPLCFNFTAAASDTENTRCLIAGATYNMDVPNFVSTELITVWSATAGAAWSAKEY